MSSCESCCLIAVWAVNREVQVEEPLKVERCEPGHLFQTYFVKFRQATCYLNNVRRFVSPASKWDWGQKRTIGFYQ